MQGTEAADCGAAKCRIDRCGHKVWDYVHFIAGVYSKHGSSEARGFAASMLSRIHLMVPCQMCQNHAKENAAKFGLEGRLAASVAQPMEPAEEGSMFHVMWQFHNFVNGYLGKPEFPLANALSAFEVCAVPSGEQCSLEGPSCDDAPMKQEGVQGAVQKPLSTLAVVGISVGGVVAVGGIVAGAILLAKRQRREPAVYVG